MRVVCVKTSGEEGGTHRAALGDAHKCIREVSTVFNKLLLHILHCPERIPALIICEYHHNVWLLLFYSYQLSDIVAAGEGNRENRKKDR